MKIRILIAFSILSISMVNAQEIGYITGVNKLGVSPSLFQPFYGFSIGAKVYKYVNIETNMYYSQRSIGSTPLADYLSFVLMPKIGNFNNKLSVFYGPGFVLNPTLNHSATQNHTYVSTLQTIGIQFSIGKHLIADAKVGQDIGLTGGYYVNNEWTKYSGPMVMLGLKLNLGSLEKSK
jgi:hypothetical protein